MSIVIAKNNTADDIEINDLNGVVVPGDGEKNLTNVFYEHEIAASNDLVSFIATGDLIINNGSNDLATSEAVRYITLHKHLNPISSDGKEVIRADSRPPGTQTYFTCVGDNVGSPGDIGGGKTFFWDFSNSGDIGGGKTFFWDFSNSDDILDESPVPVGPTIPDGFKCKRIKASFHDPLFIKDGTFYWMDASKGSYLNFYIVCPAGQYYYDRDYIPHQASEDTILQIYVRNHFFAGSCPMGDEMNAEGASDNPIPTNYELWLDVIVPESDNVSYGWASLETYRSRSYLLPGEIA